MLPFIVQKSTLVLGNVEEAMNYVIAQVQEDLVRSKGRFDMLQVAYRSL